MAVCEFCQATITKELDAVKDLGKMSSVLEDFSPIQIGTSGSFGSQPFTVIGRIQLRYDAGMWNEWYLMFEDGGSAWLGDSSGLYVITTERKGEGPLPAFGAIVPGKGYMIGGQRMIAAEVRSADCIGGQGELPLKVGQGWQARVADLRAGSSFVTLDYSDGEQPVLYNGQSVSLPDLKCQLLRDDEQIKASAGKYRGKTASLNCPSCGSGIKYLPGVTAHLVCPSCQAQLDAAGPQAQVLAAGQRADQQFSPTIKLGALAKINGQAYQVIGAMLRQDNEANLWTEYLLYNTSDAFFWLVETDEGWWRASVMRSWPDWTSPVADSVKLDNASYRKLYEYPATVQFAAGAFNWRVKAGDSVHVIEFESGTSRLAAEMNREEMTWSRSTPVAFDQLKAWFGAEVAGQLPATQAVYKRSRAAKFLLWLFALNCIPLLVNFSGTWLPLLVASLAIYLPAKFLDVEPKD
jgi:hypothetical protein